MTPRIYTSFPPVYTLIKEGRVRTVRDLAETVKGAGLDGVEVFSHLFDARLPKDLPPFQGDSLRSSPDFGISLHSDFVDFNLGSANPYIRRAGVEQLQSELMLADSRGFSPLTIHPGWFKKIDHHTALELFWASLEEFFEAAGSSSTRICLENMDHKPGKLCSLEEDIAATLERFTNLGLTVDFAHLGLRGADIEGFLRAFDTRIAHAHVSGVIPGTPHGKVSLGASDLDLRPYLERFRGRDIAVVIENGSWDVMMESREVLEKILR